MPLTAPQRRRHARQLLLPEIGSEGQARLCAAYVRAPSTAEPRARAVAEQYLVRAGCRIEGADASSPPAEHVPEGPRGGTAEEPGGLETAREVPLPDHALLARIAGDPALLEAARGLCGALAAVETIKAIVGQGIPGMLEGVPTLSPEPEPTERLRPRAPRSGRSGHAGE